MQNERIYEALRLMFPQADPLIAWRLEQGPHTGGQIAITQWNLSDPQPTQAQLDAAYLALERGDRINAIHAGHEAALAGVIAISNPTPTTVAVEAALLAATDLTGLEYARQKLATRRAELLAAVDAAVTAEALEAVVVSYPV